MLITRTEAIKNYLNKHTHSDLAALYTSEMECQVNVAPNGGIRKVSKGYTGPSGAAYTDEFGRETWYSFRIPKNAATKPEYDLNTPMTFDLDQYAESIGMTGWNWSKKQSIYVAYDFDAITGHADLHSKKLSAEEIQKIKDSAMSLDYVTVRKSTGGSGLHLYVFLEEPVTTENHNEHAALGRAILTQMGVDCDFDFIGRVDIAGGNMWVAHRKMESTNGEGLKLIKQGSTLKRIPETWMSHLSVINSKGVRASLKIFGDTDEQTEYDLLADQRSKVKLDARHKKLIEYLQTLPYTSYYEPEANRLVTHTVALKKAMEHFKQDKEFGFEGDFETVSSGNNSEQNCYAFPVILGGWVVYRFGKGVLEHESWSSDSSQNVKCLFNRPPSIRTAAVFSKGAENSKGGFSFNKAIHAVEAAKRLNSNVTIPQELVNQPCVLAERKDGKIIMSIEDKKDIARDEDMQGWVKDDKKKVWEKVLTAPPGDKCIEEMSANNYTNIVRYLVDSEKREIGWEYKNPNSKDSDWISMKKESLRDALKILFPDNTSQVLGICANCPFTLVNIPFAPEYPGNRRWNKGAPQFTVPLKQSENLNYPTWQNILDHIGKNLTTAVRENKWCKDYGILTGADYLKIWIATMFQKPSVRLPYLFLYSPGQQTGKSTFCEALESLMTTGRRSAGDILRDNFTGPLEGMVLCKIEEIDLSKNKDTYNKIKDYTTAFEITVRHMYRAHVTVANNTHWVQTANHLGYLPIEPGDQRIVVVLVDNLTQMINTDVIKSRIAQEASDFLTDMLTLELPPHAPGRMPLPVLMTEHKKRAMSAKESSLDKFIQEKCFYVPGATIEVEDFYTAFNVFLDLDERGSWTKKKMYSQMPLDIYPKGKKNKKECFGNISFTKQDVLSKKLVNIDGNLKEEEV